MAQCFYKKLLVSQCFVKMSPVIPTEAKELKPMVPTPFFFLMFWITSCFLSLPSGLDEVFCGDVAYHVVVATDDDIFVVAGLLLQHLALGNLQASRNLFYHLFVFSV